MVYGAQVVAQDEFRSMALPICTFSTDVAADTVNTLALSTA